MAYDFVDFLVDTSDEYLTGYFYKRRPKTQDDGRITFKYKQLDPQSRVFSTLLGNVIADSAMYAIKTNDHCGFNVGGYIQTQNGLFWEITEVVNNEEEKGSNDVLRWFTSTKNAECNVRMIQVTDIYSVEDAYTTDCEVEASFISSEDGSPLIIDHVSSVSTGESYNFEGNVLTFPVTKNTSATASVVFEDGSAKSITVSAYQTAGESFKTVVEV